MSEKLNARSKDMLDKPKVKEWFDTHPEAWNHFDMARAALLSYYRSENHGFINRATHPEYRFNDVSDSFVRINVSRRHSMVRFTISRKNVAPELRRAHCKKVANRWGELYQVADFQIDGKESLSALYQFLDTSSRHLANFGRIKQAASVPPIGVKNPRRMQTYVETIERNQAVVSWILAEAGGRCECCRLEAPFITTSGAPYLEVHHVRHLWDDGSDTVSNAVAVCPNCHRELHHGEKRHQLVEQLYRTVRRLKEELGRLTSNAVDEDLAKV